MRLTTLAFADFDSVHYGWAVMFKIGCNQTDGLSANDVRADIQVEETPRRGGVGDEDWWH